MVLEVVVYFWTANFFGAWPFIIPDLYIFLKQEFEWNWSNGFKGNFQLFDQYFSQFRYYFPLDRGVVMHFYQKKSISPRDI